MTDRKPARVPAGTGPVGKRLWSAITSRFDLDERETEILRMAVRQVDDLSKLEGELQDAPIITLGSAGQARVHPLFSEVRAARAAVSALLGRLDLPSEADKPATAASQRSRRAANARWDRQRQVVAERASLRGDDGAA